MQVMPEDSYTTRLKHIQSTPNNLAKWKIVINHQTKL